MYPELELREDIPHICFHVKSQCTSTFGIHVTPVKLPLLKGDQAGCLVFTPPLPSTPPSLTCEKLRWHACGSGAGVQGCG